MPFLNPACDMDVNYGDKHLENIEKIQNNAVQVLNFKNPWEPIEQIYKESKIFKLKYIVTISIFKFVYDQVNKTLPRVTFY